ncbi:MAG: flagellar type III secretion system pore protein FliP [Pseudomonadota bacterium]
MLFKSVYRYIFKYFIWIIPCFLLFSGSAHAQAITIDMGPDASLTGNIVQFFLILTVLSIAPGIIMMVTCFPFMVTVLSVLRQSLGVPQTPPNMMLMSLAIFLTFYVMEPVFTKSWDQGISPYIEGQITEDMAFDRTVTPLRDFMESRVSPETSSFMKELTQNGSGDELEPLEAETKLSVLIPSYMITEIERAFKVGFLIFIPFVIIDLVVSALLMSMGMMMLPPASISLPIKLAFFTLSDGWSLLATALVKSYSG